MHNDLSKCSVDETKINPSDEYSTQPLVSVLVPAYNVEQYLERCIQSIQDQTYQHIEIIVVDDCSPDKSGEIADKLAKKDQRIQVYHHASNLGLSGARNTGIDHAHGDYITFVDSDDWIERDYVQYLLSIIIKTDADIAISRNFFTSRYRTQITDDSVAVISPEDMLCDILYHRIHEGVWNRLYKRSLIGNKRFLLEARTGEGLQFNTQVVPGAKYIAAGLKRIYTYNVDNETSATKKPNIEKQAYGGIATINLIDKTLRPRSKRLDNGVKYQRFSTALYALINLVRAHACRENVDFYQYLVHLIREIASQTFSMEITRKQKVKSLIAWISPRLTVELSITWRYRLNRKQRV